MSIEKSEFEELDSLDEGAIVSELKGGIIEKYFYEFRQGANQIVGISWAGIRHIASRMVGQGHPISVVEMSVTYDGSTESYRALACAEDLSTHERRWGAFEQPKKFQNSNDNPFAYTLAQTKAERNAIRKFIPELAIQEAYKEYKSKFGRQTLDQK
jgi:hypothetical protein